MGQRLTKLHITRYLSFIEVLIHKAVSINIIEKPEARNPWVRFSEYDVSDQK